MLTETTVTPTGVFSLERRHCSTNCDEGVQFKTAEVFSQSAIFTLTRAKSIIEGGAQLRKGWR